MAKTRSRAIVARIYDYDGWNVGDYGVLVVYAPLRGASRRWLEIEPPRTNVSNEPRESGWCGTTNDISVTALGWYRVTAILDFVPDDSLVRRVRIKPV